MIFRSVTLVSFCLAAAFACAENGGEGDSETHWLIQCGGDAECGAGASCLCGICTVECAGASGCAAGPEGSTCVTGSGAPHCSSTVSPPAGLCLIACGDDRACAAGLECVAGACIRKRTSDPAVPNPTGDCEAPNDGARPGYSVPAEGDVWLPDCQNPLDREYYRVYATSAESAYVLPRPDGARALVQGPCQTDLHPLRPVLEKYGLCRAASNPAEVERVNDMAPADALAVTHYLHTQLVFEPVGEPPSGIDAFPLPDDVLAACDLPGEKSAELSRVCEDERRYVESGIDIGRTYASVAEELSTRLNELYGIGDDCAGGEAPGRVCTACGPVGGCSRTEVRCTRKCAAAAECGGASAGSFCLLGRCGPVGGCI